MNWVSIIIGILMLMGMDLKISPPLTKYDIWGMIQVTVYILVAGALILVPVILQFLKT
jgi:hypothetical protein